MESKTQLQRGNYISHVTSFVTYTFSFFIRKKK